MMKAVVTEGKGTFSLVDVDMPTLGAYDCLVKIEAFLFCNTTDRHLVEGTFPPCPIRYPALLGHECVGRVIQVGSKVKHFAEGDRVLRPYCLNPDEMLSGYYSAWGGFAEYGRVTDWQAIVADQPERANEGFLKYQQLLPDGMTLQQAAMMITLKEILSAVNKLPDFSGKKCLVTGAGSTACLFGRLLKIKGAGQVTMVARRKEPLEFAVDQHCADDTCTLDHLERLDHDFELLIDATGALAVLKRLVAQIRDGGAIFSYGIYDEMGDDRVFDELRKRTTYARLDPDEPSAHEEACQMVLNKRIDLEPYITHTFPLAQLVDAWATVVERRTLKTMVLT